MVYVISLISDIDHILFPTHTFVQLEDQNVNFIFNKNERHI